jgi:CRISPR-associated protein Cmr4
MINYFYLLSPLHTGATTQEGNLLGIARESHTNLPYIPSSTIRGRLRASVLDKELRFKLFGTELKDSQQLEQGDIWIGDASILWLPVPSLSHSVVWISCPMLLRRWLRSTGNNSNLIPDLPADYSCNFTDGQSPIYLKDAIIQADTLNKWENSKEFLPANIPVTIDINRMLVLPDQHCTTLIQMSLWRQVKIKLDEHKSVDGGFRYEEAIPPDTLMYFSSGTTSQANGSSQKSDADFKELLAQNNILQIGGQESLGRGFVQQFNNSSSNG